MNRNLFYILKVSIISLLAFVVYSQTFDDEFHFDDMFFIVDNTEIRNIGNIKDIWTTTITQPSRFVGFMSFALNYHFHKLNVFGYHLANLIIHIFSGVFVLWLAQMLLFLVNKDSKKNSWIAFFAALIFVAHPVQTQAVTYISQRFASLATLFYLMSLCFYLKGRIFCKKKSGSIVCFVVSAIAAVLGMFTKEIVITLSIMIIFVECLFIRGTRNELDGKTSFGIRYMSPKYLPLLLFPFFLIIPALFQFGFKAIFFTKHVSKSHFGDVFTFSTYILTQFRVLALFIRMLFLPFNQNLDHDFVMSRSFFEWDTFLSFIFLVLLIVFAIKTFKRNKIVSFGILWFFIVLSINFIPRQHIIFEHKLYLASVGFCISLSYFVISLFRDVKRGIAVLSIVVILFSALTFKRNKVWDNEITLWEDVLSKSPNKTKPLINLGNAYFKKRKYEKALELFQKAVVIDDKAEEAYNGMGLIYKERGEFERALENYNKVLVLKPGRAQTFSNRGVVYKSMGEYELAMLDQNISLSLNPNAALTYINRGVVYKSLGEYDLALADYQKALEIDPRLASGFANRGVIYKKQGKDELALIEYEKALKIDPYLGQVYYNRSLIFNDLGDKPKALKDILKAIELGINVDPKYIEWLIK
ncbi:MAG: tetratricopeptide repeat protein [Candidatus Omnitrophica bacterium]|nr:tetratricopeptide repeat protein [Candidatus Omnitrophota bacterium]MBU1995628.1 tetratricopeptide repeat protein [Candidatus Omnitrophota bacterium]